MYNNKILTTGIHPQPLVSCIMPTANRPQFIKKTIDYFQSQDYPHKELLIVYNEDTDLPPTLAVNKNIRLIKITAKSIGAKRNEACRQATGPLIAQWDDDDLYHPSRLSRQLQPILAGVAELTALQDILFYEPATEKCWACSPDLSRRLFAENVAAGTLVFLKTVWERTTGFPATSLREDADFMARALQTGARLQRIDGRDLFIYLRHGANTWRFQPGTYLQQSGWTTLALPPWAAAHQPFYRQLFSRVPAQQAAPLVSCIMPTANRPQFISRSIRNFLEQDYSNKELIIVDDGHQTIAHLIPENPQIKYFRTSITGTIGAKRNQACALAGGDIIVHWDDDDWYAPDWITHQVKVLQTSGADLTGLSTLFFYAPQTDTAWKYSYPLTDRPWVAGATMAYKRSLWQRYRFRELHIGEDNDFAWHSGARVHAHHYEEGFVSTIHPGNTSPKLTGHSRWRSIPSEKVRALLPKTHNHQPQVVSI
jgi:glycosyltransferase involved in cell wall biosynthesis